MTNKLARNMSSSYEFSNHQDDVSVHYYQVAALVILAYDHLLTLDCEVEYVWKRSWSKSKALFILARYFGDILLILLRFSKSQCEFHRAIGLKSVGIGSMIIIFVTQMIMQFRIKALYGKVVSKIITVFWILQVMAVLSLGIASLVAIDVHPVLSPNETICNPTYLPRYASLFWVPVIAFETFLFALACRIAYRNYLEIGDWRGEIGNWRGAALLHIILRDNFQFFICAFAAYIATALTWAAANPKYFTVPGSFSCALTAIMGCRLIINLSKEFYHPVANTELGSPPSIWGVTTMSGMRFVTRPPLPVAAGDPTSTSPGEHHGGQSFTGKQRCMFSSITPSIGQFATPPENSYEMQEPQSPTSREQTLEDDLGSDKR